MFDDIMNIMYLMTFMTQYICRGKVYNISHTCYFSYFVMEYGFSVFLNMQLAHVRTLHTLLQRTTAILVRYYIL